MVSTIYTNKWRKEYGAHMLSQIICLHLHVLSPIIVTLSEYQPLCVDKAILCNVVPDVHHTYHSPVGFLCNGPTNNAKTNTHVDLSDGKSTLMPWLAGHCCIYYFSILWIP